MLPVSLPNALPGASPGLLALHLTQMSLLLGRELCCGQEGIGLSLEPSGAGKWKLLSLTAALRG